MLRQGNNNEGVWFNFKVRGENIKLKIKAMSTDIMTKIRNKNKITKPEINSMTRQMEKIVTFDEDAISAALIDHVLEDFKNIGNEAGEPLEPNIENKQWIMNLMPLSGELSIAEFVFEKSRELETVNEEEKEEHVKNS